MIQKENFLFVFVFIVVVAIIIGSIIHDHRLQSRRDARHRQILEQLERCVDLAEKVKRQSEKGKKQ